jgi:hypothetical protein
MGVGTGVLVTSSVGASETGSLVVALFKDVRFMGRMPGHRPRLGPTFDVACAVVALGF